MQGRDLRQGCCKLALIGIGEREVADRLLKQRRVEKLDDIEQRQGPSPSASSAAFSAICSRSSKTSSISKSSGSTPPSWKSCQRSWSMKKGVAPASSASSAAGLPLKPWMKLAPCSTGTPRLRSVKTRPPIRSRASSTITSAPDSARLAAAERPAIPAPTTTTFSPLPAPELVAAASLGAGGDAWARARRTEDAVDRPAVAASRRSSLRRIRSGRIDRRLLLFRGQILGEKRTTAATLLGGVKRPVGNRHDRAGGCTVFRRNRNAKADADIHHRAA